MSSSLASPTIPRLSRSLVQGGLALVLGIGLLGCGGATPPQETFDEARAQFQAGDYAAARTGFSTVSKDAAADPELRTKARLFGAVCAGFVGDGAAAMREFGELDAAEGGSLAADRYRWAAEQLADAGQVPAAVEVIKLATARFPDQRSDFEAIATRLMEEGSADAAKELEGLGYLK